MILLSEYGYLLGLAPAGFLLGWAISRQMLKLRIARARRAARASSAQVEFATAAQQAVGDIKNSVEGLAGVVHGAERRIADLERQFQMLENSAARVGRRQGFQEAIVLAREGAEPADIASRCGVSRAEAELLAQVHARRNTH